MKRQLLMILLALVLLLSISPLTALASQSGNGEGNAAKIGEQPYKSLSEAIENAKDGDIIKLVAEANLSQTVTLSGKSITITADEPHKIKGGSDMITLIEVSQDASLTLNGMVVVDGTGMKRSAVNHVSNGWYYLYNGIGMLNIHGVLNVEGDVSIQNYELGNMAGAINVSGEKAVLNLRGGSITNCNAPYDTGSYAFCAPVRVGGNAIVNMTGGVIEKNFIDYIHYDEKGGHPIGRLSYYASGGIFISYSGTLNMSGGCIKNNTAFRGSAIHVYGGTEVNITKNALISDNTCGEKPFFKTVGDEEIWGAGAIFIELGGRLSMSGGTVSNNKGGQGGGISLVSAWNNTNEFPVAVFDMTGGTISGNTANVGGGIYSYTNGATIAGGTIINNTAENLGGGIYSEGNSKSYSTVHLQNVVIHHNTAYVEGGGLWTCPTGGAAVYVTNGGAIYENAAVYDPNGYTYLVDKSAAGDDIASGSQDQYSMTLATRILGGGDVGYYVDGGLKTYDGNDYIKYFYPVVDPAAARYGKNTNTEKQSVVRSSDYWALKSQAEGIALAQELSKVVISGNKAAYGGGIGANGGVVIGSEDEELIQIAVTKAWDNGGSADDPPESVTVYLKNGDSIIETVELNAKNNWHHIFKDLPRDGAYTVEERAVDNYSCKVTGSAEEGFKITNTYELPQGTDEADNPSETDTPPDEVPKTGDTMRAAPCLLLMLLSLTGMVVLVRRRPRRVGAHEAKWKSPRKRE